MSARLLACLVLTLIGAVRSSPALLGTSTHTVEQSMSCESSAPRLLGLTARGELGALLSQLKKMHKKKKNELSTSESSTSDQQSHQGKATLSYTVRWHVVKVPGLGTVPQLVTVDSAATDQAALTMLPSSATACLLPFISEDAVLITATPI